MSGCGTTAGYRAHRRAGEAPCAECLAAESRRGSLRYHADPEFRRAQSIRSRAQSRAKTDLSHAFPAEYRELYAKHKAALRAEEGS